MQPFECQRCGQCCHGEGGIVLTGRDIDRLAEHLSAQGLNKSRFLAEKTVDKHGKRRLATTEGGWCVFYDAEIRGCGVHLARPDVCRAWPFFRGNMVDESSWRMIQDDYCPGVRGEAGFEAFVRFGREYLKEHGLANKDDDAPNALKPE